MLADGVLGDQYFDHFRTKSLFERLYGNKMLSLHQAA